MIRVILNVSCNVQRVNYRSKVINNDPKTEESTMFFIDALSRALPQKLLGDAISTQFILKYFLYTSPINYIGSIIILAFASDKLISKSYAQPNPCLKLDQ